MVADWLIIVSLIFGGCCANMYSLEYLVKNVTDSIPLITLSQFIIVSIEGLFVNIQFNSNGLPYLRKRTVPLHRWIIKVLMFFLVSNLNNLAFKFSIPMTLHIIFRSSSLVVSLILSWLLHGKKFTFLQISGVSLVTIGIIASTLASTRSQSKDHDPKDILIGVMILLLAVILSSFLGLYQQATYTKYGKAWREALFYTHVLGLPLFLIYYQDILTAFQVYSSSEPISFRTIAQDKINVNVFGFLSDFELPKLWYFLILNSITQYICITGVHKLSSMATSVTLNLMLTLRKFMSLMLSVFIFGNPFGFLHAFGAVSVLFGTLLYASSKDIKHDINKKTK